jgi:hypothetical protein
MAPCAAVSMPDTRLPRATHPDGPGELHDTTDRTSLLRSATHLMNCSVTANSAADYVARVALVSRKDALGCKLAVVHHALTSGVSSLAPQMRSK